MTYQRLTGTKVSNWLGTNYRNAAGNTLMCTPYPPVIPDSPDELVIVTMLPGTGFDHERAFEIRSFQIRCRSLQNTPWIAEANSMGIDTLLMSMMMPWKPDGAFVNELGWTGGGPSPLPADDTANRYSWVCTYYCKSATGF